MSDYATIQDVETLFRPLTQSEQTRAASLIPTVCSRLRIEAARAGKDLDAMVDADADFASVAKSVTVDIVARCLMTPTDGAPMTQSTESALGYSFSGTFLNPGGGLFIKREELKALGIHRTRVGVINTWPCME